MSGIAQGSIGKAGGRFGVRRRAVSVAAAAALAGLVALTPTAAAQTRTVVDVEEERGLYRVEATFSVPEAPAVARAVLTDYARIPRFMPDVRSSEILERSEDRAVVQQEAVARFLMFSKRIRLVLDVEEDGMRIRFRDRCGKSFSRYEGGWTIAERDGWTVVTYELSAKPSFDVPEFLLKRLLERDANRMIERLKAEIAARARDR